jgi:lysophospholipase L1-like esterase
MKKINPARQPLFIIFFTLLIAVAFNFIPQNIILFGYELKHVDMISDIKSIDEPAVSPEQVPVTKASAPGSEILSALLNKLFYSESPVQTATQYLYGDVKQLSNFFDALKNAKASGVRIAHYGDSAIEGDLISADFREALQSKFGGSALGHLGIVSQDITFRTTVKHSFSPENTWETASLYSSNLKGLPLGISGEVVVPKGNSWVRYEIQKVQKSLKEFKSIRIFYTNAKNSTVKVYFNDGGAAKTANLVSGVGVKELVVKSDVPAKSVKVEFPEKDQAYIFGISLEGDPGVYVDNFPLRGNSGMDIQKISADMLKNYSKLLDYKLIILEFGLNLTGKQDYAFYEREMSKVINLLKSAYPKSSILMISVHDKSVKQGTSYVTDPSVLKLLETQKNIAAKNGVALFSLFDAMGGQNSMPKWVKNNPPLASNDFVHFNVYGAKKVSDLLVNALMTEYNKRK